MDDGPIITGAGSAAGLDLCLHLVRLDHGAAAANAVARRLVIAPHRDGGQAQYIEAAIDAPGGHDGVAGSIQWALDNLARPITTAELAQVAHMSEHSYLRHFGKATGTTPLRWLVGQRLAAARELLETGEASIAQVGAASGFADPATFRHHVTRLVGTTPTAYRRTFQR